ncbi:MAG: serine/threonine protein kinase [Bryobacterales bacterium]|nr:serine/threonine protein kinase [Bryobacterales bacterium]
MNVRRASSGTDSPSPATFRMPPALVEKVAQRLCWVSLICAITTVIGLSLQHFLQPDLRAVLGRPLVRLTSLGVILMSAGFVALQVKGLVKKTTLLDLGILFQLAVSFALATFETSMDWSAAGPVRGVSSLTVWLALCGLLLPNAPAKAGLAALGCAAMWPLAYTLNLHLYQFQPLPWNRLTVWIYPPFLMAGWTFLLNKKIFSMHLSQQKAEELGSYTLDYMIGHGGMGEVWRAKHRMLARDAAIKLIRPAVLSSVSGRQASLIQKRFEREARVTASLRSPHTVALFDFGKTKDAKFYYVMELLDGIDLQTLVERFGPMPAGRVARILLQACESLEEAHRMGIIHRDIKPRNIFLCKLGLRYDFVKVLDFGLVKTLMPDELSIHTMEGTATGTPAYLSPEIALGHEKIDGRADLYSLGCLAYYLLSGQLVFPESNPTAQALAHVQKMPVRLSERTDLPIPAGLERIIMNLLEKEPAKRIWSAQELGRQLRRLQIDGSWSDEDAVSWWQTNLPERPAPAARREEASGDSHSSLSPVGPGLSSRAQSNR